MKKVLIAPSILAADFSRLCQEIDKVKKAGADWIHIDVMDGHFVPNLTIGAPVVKHLRKCTRLLLDSHLMIENPEKYIKEFAEAGSDVITVHAEATRNLKDLIKRIKAYGIKAGVSIRPKTSLSAIAGVLGIVDLVLIMTVEPGFGGQKFMTKMLPKIRKLRETYAGDIFVDGGINSKTAKPARKSGANGFVAGTYIFGSKNVKKAINSLR